MGLTEKKEVAWVAAADMGLGHKRAAWPLRFLGVNGVHITGSDAATKPSEKALWDKLRGAYESASRLNRIPVIGSFLFKLYDKLLAIPTAYPFRDLSGPTMQTSFAFNLVKQGIGGSLMDLMKSRPLPLVSTFYIPSLAADEAGWGRVYCVITDTDANRVWVSRNPRQSRIEYLVPCGRALRRLKQYGVPDERIYMTGFPLPLELTGDDTLDVLRRNLGKRLARLDPSDRFWSLHKHSVEHFLGLENCPAERGREAGPITVTFAVGGAGAQKEIAVTALESFAPQIEAGNIRMNLVAGVRREVREYFEKAAAAVSEGKPEMAAGIRVIFGESDAAYFDAFAECLHETDVLWTKPSELSFYSGLGLPILMAPTIGAQEDCNHEWLLEVQAGIDQKDPRFAREWLSDLLTDGRLAEAAWDGFLKARKYGTYKIAELVSTGAMSRESNPLKR
ncbi:MAG TPA: hypothetical protein DIC34_22005 [Treponema sp.]|nr:hypothetical protein [Treponema sp.]